MGTFDIGHPDVMDFIRAKREDGRLRQFNLSLLVTDEFMHAVEVNRGRGLLSYVESYDEAYDWFDTMAKRG